MISTTVGEHLLMPAYEYETQGLAAEVEQALWDDPRLRSTDSQVRVEADAEGVVTLSGHVRGDMLKSLAGQRVRQVSGVSQVVNALVADTDLECELAMTLAMSPAVGAYTDLLTVKVILGVAHISGVLQAADQATAEAALAEARKLALGLPGLREVMVTARAQAGATSAAAGGEAVETSASASSGDQQAAMASRLAVWHERAAAK